LKKKFKVLFYVCLSAVGLVGIFLIAVVGWFLWTEYRLPPPSEQQVRQQFENHKTDYFRLVALLRKYPSAKYVGDNDNTEYQTLARKIGIKDVTIREDGSMEFALWGYGGTIEDDSYMGVRYFPKDHKVASSVGYPGWPEQTVVVSLDSAKLPQERGSVASGLYVVAIEPEWFIYRFEYRE
jgi:hypothetical protein